MSNSFGPLGKVSFAAPRHGLLGSTGLRSGLISRLDAFDTLDLVAQPSRSGTDALRFLFGAAPLQAGDRAPLPAHDHHSIQASAPRGAPTLTSGCMLEIRHAAVSWRAKIGEACLAAHGVIIDVKSRCDRDHLHCFGTLHDYVLSATPLPVHI
jgi:hypothetical protein